MNNKQDKSLKKNIIAAVIMFIVLLVIISIKIITNNKSKVDLTQNNNETLTADVKEINNENEDNNYEDEFNEEIIKERFEKSYSYLIDEINNFNTSVALKNQQQKILQLPQKGKVCALYSKSQNDIVYMHYYGQAFGTEIIWIDQETESPYAKYAGNAGQTIMKPYFIRAINAYGSVVDNRNANVDFSIFTGIIELIKNPETEEAKNVANTYILKEFDWAIDNNNIIFNGKIASEFNKTENVDVNKNNSSETNMNDISDNSNNSFETNMNNKGGNSNSSLNDFQKENQEITQTEQEYQQMLENREKEEAERHQQELRNYSGVYIERDDVRAIDFTDNEDIKRNLTDITCEYYVYFMPSLRGSLGENSIYLNIYHKETGKMYKEYQHITPVEGINTFTVTLSAAGMSNYKEITNSFIYNPKK